MEDDIDVDALLSDIESPNPPMGMGGDEPKADAAPAPAAAAPSPWDPKPWEFDHNGRKVLPDSQEKAKTWMSQGYNYSQRMAEMNRRQDELAKQGERYKGFDRYGEVDAYAKQNPDWWKFVEEQWQTRSQQPAAGGAALPPELEGVLKPLQQEIETLRAWREEQLSATAKQEEQRHDEALSKDIESIRDANPTIDFDAVDQSGTTLEGRILKHAAEIGTTSFRAAFRDYLHDQLLESSKAAKLAADAKTPDKLKAAGILGTSPTPRRAAAAPVNVKGRSWDDVAKDAMDDLGIQ